MLIRNIKNKLTIKIIKLILPNRFLIFKNDTKRIKKNETGIVTKYRFMTSFEALIPLSKVIEPSLLIVMNIGIHINKKKKYLINLCLIN